MKLVKKTLNSLLLIAIFALIIFLTFKRLPYTFFQQDEWWTFGRYIYREKTGGIIGVLLDTFISGKIHVNPLLKIIYYLEFKQFGTDFPGYAWVSMSIHFINTLLVYYLANLLLKNKRLSLIAATLFGINSISHQAVSWVSATLQTQGAMLFSLLFSVFFLNYLLREKKKKLLLNLSLLCIFMTLMFKEIALPFFLLPVFLVFYSREKNLWAYKNILVPLSLGLMIYLLVRIVIFVNAPPIVLGLTEVLEQPHPSVYFYRIISLPFKLLPESILPTEWLLNSSKMIIRLAYPHFLTQDGTPNPYLVETAGLDLVNYFLSAIMLVVFYACYRIFKKQKKDELAAALIVSLVIIIGSTFLIIFIPGKAGYVSIIEPRHLYGATIGSSLFLVLSLFAFFSLLTKKIGKVLLLVTVIFLPIIGLHIKLVWRDLALLEARSVLRKSFLVTIKNHYPKLPPKVIFYVQSDQAYYGMPAEEKNLPVQSGFGRMLMVWYQDSEEFPGCFYRDIFLHDLIAQGYRYCDGRGFGYFRQYDKFKKAYEENQLSPNEVFVFTFSGKTNQLTDITQEVRARLVQEVKNEKD